MKNKIFTALLCSSVLALGACGGGHHANKHASLSYDKGVDSALQKAAQVAQDQGASRESLLFYEELYRRNPKDVLATKDYTKALRHAGQVEKAEIILEAWQGKDVSLDVEYGKVLLALGRFPEAQNIAHAVLKKDKDNAGAHHVLGLALDANGLHAEAEKHLRLALENWQGSPVPVLNNLALNLAAQDKKSEALALVDKALIYAPHEEYLNKNRALIASLKGALSHKAPRPVAKPS
jgi:Flp pilus assembly protein TadD